MNVIFFKTVWECVKSFKTVKGLIAFAISFSIFVGWALFFIVFGAITANNWMLGVGSSVVAFWMMPFTPMWMFIIITTYVIQRFILADIRSMTWDQVKNFIKKMNEMEKSK